MSAQELDKEMQAFARQFQEAFNKEDHAAL
jgi:hypothetical protein